MIRLYAIFLASLLTLSNSYAEWRLKSAESNVYYVSTKNLTVSELNYFNTLTGTIDEAGNLIIKINLESIETGIPIRNERVKSMLFEVINYGKATVSATINPDHLSKLKVGQNHIETVDFTLDLHGHRQTLSTTVNVIRHSNGNLLVTPITPIIITAKQFGLENGIEKLRKIARLESISPTVPVTFNLTFSPVRS